MANRELPKSSYGNEDPVDWGLGPSTRLPSDSTSRRIIELPDDDIWGDRLSVPSQPESSHKRFHMPQLPRIHVPRPHLPHFMRRREDTSTYQRPPATRPSLLDLPDNPLPRSRPASTYGRSVWDDDAELQAMKRRNVERAAAEEARAKGRRKKKVAAVATAATVAVGGGAVASPTVLEALRNRPPTATASPSSENKSSSSDSTSSNAPEENNDPADLNGDGNVSEIEETAFHNRSLIPSAEDLPEVLDTPLRNKKIEKMDREAQANGDTLDDWYDQKGEVSVLVDDYEPAFVGAYKSITGMKLNVYVDSLPDQQDVLDQEFKINPESIEFILTMIKRNIQDAPETPTKDAIIQNLEDMQSGKDDRLYQLVFDMSDQPSCFGANEQLIKFVRDACDYAAITLITGADEGETSNIPILVNTGLDSIMVASDNPADMLTVEQETSMTEKEITDWWEEHSMKEETKVDRGNQASSFAHEMGHGLSGAEGNFADDTGDTNTYEKGDKEHEVIDWLLGDRQSGEYDTPPNPSPNLGEQIELLVEAGLLKPIVELKK